MTHPGGSTSTGLTPNLAGALAYVLGPITGILFLVLEKENRFVRFHAMQSIIVSVVWFILSNVLSFLLGVLAAIPILGWLVGILVSFGMAAVGLLLWLLLMWKAFSGEEWEFPVLGAFARQQVR